MKTCNAYSTRFIEAYTMGFLEAEEADTFRQHLSQCSECQGVYSMLKAEEEAISTAIKVDVPDALSEQIFLRIRKRIIEKQRNYTLYYIAAIMPLFVVALVFVPHFFILFLKGMHSCGKAYMNFSLGGINYIFLLALPWVTWGMTRAVLERVDKRSSYK